MTNRVIDLAEEPVRLSVRLGQLVIQRHESTDITVPLEDIAALVVGHKAVVYTHAALAGLVASGGTVVLCDDARLPVAMLAPLQGHHLQVERIAQQAAAPLPARKRLWQQIVRAKIRAQGRLLQDLRRDDRGLLDMSRRVRSGDPDNLEAQASRRYWPVLFDNAEFRRNRDAQDQNRYLNYGYAVLRATVARALAASGLCLALGLHHHNRYSGFPLADDLMEPFRPVIDRAAVLAVDEFGPNAPLDKRVKAVLLGAVANRFLVDGEERTLFDVLARTAASLAKVYAREENDLLLPDL